MPQCIRGGSDWTIVRAATLGGVADQTRYLTQSQCADTGPISSNADIMPPGIRQGVHYSNASSRSSDGHSSLLDEGGSAPQVPQATLELVGYGGVVWPDSLSELLVDGL